MDLVNWDLGNNRIYNSTETMRKLRPCAELGPTTQVKETVSIQDYPALLTPAAGSGAPKPLSDSIACQKDLQKSLKAVNSWLRLITEKGYG